MKNTIVKSIFGFGVNYRITELHKTHIFIKPVDLLVFLSQLPSLPIFTNI